MIAETSPVVRHNSLFGIANFRRIEAQEENQAADEWNVETDGKTGHQHHLAAYDATPDFGHVIEKFL